MQDAGSSTDISLNAGLWRFQPGRVSLSLRRCSLKSVLPGVNGSRQQLRSSHQQHSVSQDSEPPMKTKAAARSLYTGCLLGVPAALLVSSATPCDAFVISTGSSSRSSHVLVTSAQHQHAAPSALRPLALPRPRAPFARHVIGDFDTLGNGSRRTRNHSTSYCGKGGRCTMSAAGESASGRNAFSSVPSGPGAGVINLEFRDLKTGGFKVFLLFFLLGQGRAKDNDTPFSVRDTPEGIRVLIGDETKNESQWDGVLDLSWGTAPRPFFRVDRIDVNEVIPYPGELYILNKLLDAIIDVNGERSVEEQQKLFVFQQGEQGQLAAAKAKLAGLASL